MIYKRNLQNLIEEKLFKSKVVILYGPRQVGKTTLVKNILSNFPDKKSSYFNCEEIEVKQALSTLSSTKIKSFLGDNQLVILDEAQKIQDIGSILKLLVDTFPEIQIIATGSSSFELSNKIQEPLTGRKYEFFLPPIAISELEQEHPKYKLNSLLEDFLRYGLYPEVLSLSNQEKEEKLVDLTSSYLYQDIFSYQSVKNPDQLHQLVQALALQIGQEVSYNELSNKLKLDIETVQRYILLLERAFVIHRLQPFSRNLRKEITSKRKIYFWDLGIRNALVRSFNPLNLRTDTGHLWENFCITERFKFNQNRKYLPNKYFWRTQD